jgi:hypothetical protein
MFPGASCEMVCAVSGELHRENASTEGTCHRCCGRHVGAHDAQSLKCSEREGYDYRRSAELSFRDAHLLTPSFHCSYQLFDFSHPPRIRPKPKGGGGSSPGIYWLTEGESTF